MGENDEIIIVSEGFDEGGITDTDTHNDYDLGSHDGVLLYSDSVDYSLSLENIEKYNLYQVYLLVFLVICMFLKRD